jgi:hypothetical protein
MHNLYKFLFTIPITHIYLGVRYSLPKQNIIYDFNDRELLSVQSTNLIFCDRVSVWYDKDNWCGEISNYYWRRTNIIKINIKEQNNTK